MNEYTVIVPCNFNDGKEVDFSQFQFLENELLTRFGGYTNAGYVEGAWIGPNGKIYRDRSVRYIFATEYDIEAQRMAELVAIYWKQECVYLSQTSTNVRFIEPNVTDDEV